MTSSSDKPPFSPPAAGMGTALPGTGFPGADLPAPQAGGGAPRTELVVQTGSAEGLLAPPAVSLPKGGGAIQGIGESFSANPVTGTASVTLPLAVSPGRSGFGPSLSLSYRAGGRC